MKKIIAPFSFHSWYGHWKHLLLGLCTWLLLTPCAGQDSTRYTLSAGEVMAIVRAYHPLAKKARLEIEKAAAAQTEARGGFDPVWNHYVGQKRFDGTNYYFQNQSQLEIPVWFGVNITGGIEFLEGDRLSVERTGGRTGFVGVDIPLAKNLLMDKRRATLKSAAIYKQMSETEQKLMLNDLLRESLESYWLWTQAYREWQLVGAVLSVNEKRMDFIRKMVAQGEMAAIDSTEALAQLQYYRAQFNKARLNRQTTAIELSAYLWMENEQPFTLNEDIVPDNRFTLMSSVESAPIPLLDSLLLAGIAGHPQLRLLDQQLDLLEIEKKLRFQDLLPDLRVQYNQLGKGYELWKYAADPIMQNNYRYGISIGVPLRLSAGRGGYRKTKIEINQTRLDRMQKELELRNMVQQQFARLNLNREQISILAENSRQNDRLLAAEEIRLQNGESSLFLVNSRENRALDARLSLLNAQTEFLRTVVAVQWAVANLN